MFNLEDARHFIAELEVPFPPALIDWRVMATAQDATRGHILPYADQRAYTDRLNQVFTPGGWTRRYRVTTSPSFERAEDKKLVAKVFVTCDLTIYGIGSHSATGEEWADDEHAGTSAEAQAFKRACSCFGLGRYLYDFIGTWVDRDDRQRPKEEPQLFDWATPEGWRKGLRPVERTETMLRLSKEPKCKAVARKYSPRPKRMLPPQNTKLIKEIEALVEVLGRPLYRGLLKGLARVWNPNDIHDLKLLTEVLSQMRAAEQELGRIKLAQEKTGPEEMKAILASLEIKSIDRIESLETLRRLAQALDEKMTAALN